MVIKFMFIPKNKYGDIILPLTKEMGINERDYYNSIIKNINEQMEDTIKYLDSEEAKEEFFKTQKTRDQFFKEFHESGLYNTLNQHYANITPEDSTKLIEEFYRIGSGLGYNDLNKTLNFSPADEKALSYIQQYNFGLIRNMNDEFMEGIRNTIFEGVSAGKGADEVKQLIKELPLQPLKIDYLDKDGNIQYSRTLSTDTRAELIARTEHARAVNAGTLQAYANYGVEKVDVITTGGADVCEECQSLEDNSPYDITEASGLLPAHPNCECCFGAHIDLDSNPDLPADDPENMNLVPVEFENWKYIDENRTYTLQGNTEESRTQFMEKYKPNFEGKPKYQSLIQTYTNMGDKYLNSYGRGIMTYEESRKEWNNLNNKYLEKSKVEEGCSFDEAWELKDSLVDECGVPLEKDTIFCRRENHRYMGRNGEETYTDGGFTSTTIYEYAKEYKYGYDVNYILVPAGTKILYLEGTTLTENDYEVLFPPNTTFNHLKDLGLHKKIWKYQ